MGKAAPATLFCLIAAALSGCSTDTLTLSAEQRLLKQRYLYCEYPDNPVPGLKRVGLVVLDAAPQYHPDLNELSSALYGELQQVPGLQVIPNRAVVQALDRSDLALPRDALDLADDMSLDGLFIAIVTDYQPYGEPSVATALTLFSRATAPVGRFDLDKIVQGGKPLTMPRSPADGPVTAVFGAYDASQAPLRQRIQWFGEGRGASKSGLGWEQYYRSMPNYMRFVSYEMVWKLFDTLLVKESQEERAGM